MELQPGTKTDQDPAREKINLNEAGRVKLNQERSLFHFYRTPAKTSFDKQKINFTGTFCFTDTCERSDTGFKHNL